MTRRLKEQRTLLQASDVPTAEFVQNFKISHNIAKALSVERKSCAQGQLELLRKKAQQGAYVEEARKRPKPPLPSLIEQQEQLSALRRDAPSVLQPAEEAPERYERRQAKRKAFLDARKSKHDEAMFNFEESLDSLAERCQASAKMASEQMLRCVEQSDTEIDLLLKPLERDTERLVEKTDEAVHAIMSELENIIETRRAQIDEFTSGLQELDKTRRVESEALMKELVAQLTDAAHVVPGEIERIVEQKSLDLNTALLENDRSVKTLNAKLSVQALEKSKDNKVRWHKGLLLWKQKRHTYALEEVMERIRSPEFREPPIFLEVLERLRKKQREVYQDRADIVEELSRARLKELSAARVRSMEEANVTLNDRVQEAWDEFIIELRELKDGVDVKAQGMLGFLCQELELHDARQEWGEYESALDLVNATVRPHLAERQKGLEVQINNVIETLQNQDEKQNTVVVRMVSLFLSLAKKQEHLASSVNFFEAGYEGDVEDCKDKFEESRLQREDELTQIKATIADAAHFETLEEFKEKAFQHLDELGEFYREHADQLLCFHAEYPGNVATFIQKETQTFCNDLGLLTEAQWQAENPVDEENPPADDAEGPLPPPEWTLGQQTGCTVFERLTLPQLREHVMHAFAGGGSTDDDDDAASVPAAPVGAEVGGVAGSGGEDSAAQVEFPTLLDGSIAIEQLGFEAPWVEERLEKAREAVFAEIASRRVYLDRVDITSRCEEAKRDRDHRLREHTNRKGEVQVECYMPRYALLDKHKDKFIRHTTSVLDRYTADEDELGQLFEKLETHHESYQERFNSLQEKLGEAENLPDLIVCQRQGLDLAEEFKQTCAQLYSRMEALSSSAITKLWNDNMDFLTSCECDKTYSKSELEDNNKSISDINKKLDNARKSRQERVKQLAIDLVEHRTGPLEAFQEAHQKAHQELCIRKGLGRSEGAKRREAQGACKTLIARGVTLREHLKTLLSFFRELCELPVDDAIEVSTIPACQSFPFRPFLSRADVWGEGTKHDWTFTAELVGLLYVIVCILNFTALHLDALSDKFASKYQMDSIPRVAFFDEREPLCTASEDTAADPESTHEAIFRRECLQSLVGPLLHAESFSTTIAGIRQTVEDFYNARGGLPDFIKSFLFDERKGMVPSADRTRLEAAVVIREQCDTLRGDTLLQIGDALFGELAARTLRGIRERAVEVLAQNTNQWRSLDRQRASHEQRLNPGLANPNAEAQLAELIEAEKARFKAGQKLIKEDRVLLSNCLRQQADSFVCCLAARFEAAIRLIDAVPLHGHFVNLPGDEHVEPPRMSIKRRMRRMIAGASVDTGNDKLQERSWAGLPLNELRQKLSGEEWPPDEKLAGASPEVLQASSPNVDSFRSPVHRKLFERRGYYYSTFMAEFTNEVARRNQQLIVRESKEQAGQDNWVSNIRQLTGGDTRGADDVEDPPPPPEEPPAEEPPPAGRKK